MDDVTRCRKAARFYRRQGWNPLPSRMDAKRPLVRFAELWSSQGPSWWWTTRSPRFRTTNVQVMTGTAWRLIVVDLDGPEAISAWSRITAGSGVPSTWASGRDTSRSLHLWFSLPEDVEVCPSRTLWIGPGKHNRIDFLADRKLVVAPPSIHVETGQRYRFLEGHGPKSIPFPAEAPSWLLRTPDCEAAAAPIRPAGPPPPVRTSAPGTSRRGPQWDRREVQEALRGRWDQVARWMGWKVVGTRPNRGWLDMCVPWREDRNPSGGINKDDGRVAENGGCPISFYDAAVRTGQSSDWRDAVNRVGANFGVTPKFS